MSPYEYLSQPGYIPHKQAIYSYYVVVVRNSKIPRVKTVSQTSQHHKPVQTLHLGLRMKSKHIAHVKAKSKNQTKPMLKPKQASTS